MIQQDTELAKIVYVYKIIITAFYVKYVLFKLTNPAHATTE